jgi:hypothetical protein
MYVHQARLLCGFVDVLLCESQILSFSVFVACRINARSIWSRVTMSCMPSHPVTACTHGHHCRHHVHYLPRHRRHCRHRNHHHLVRFFLLITPLASRCSLPLGCTHRSSSPTRSVSTICCSPPCCDVARAASARQSRFRRPHHRMCSVLVVMAATKAGPASTRPVDCTWFATPVLETGKLPIVYAAPAKSAARVKLVGPQCTDSTAATCGSSQRRPRSRPRPCR